MFGFGKRKGKEEHLTSFLPDEAVENQILGIKDLVAPGALRVNPRHLQLGEKYARTFFIVSYPRFLNKNWFSPIINLDAEFDISIFIHPLETKTILRKFRKKVAQVESQIYEKESKGMVRDPQLDVAYKDLENLRDNLQQAIEKLFEVGVYITIYGTTEKELSTVERQIRAILESKLIFIKPSTFQQKEGFRSTIPLGEDLLGIHQKLNSSTLSSIFPFVSFDLSGDRGILYGVNRHNNSLILFDRFKLPNYNSVTFATSGAGKSFAVKLEVLRSLMVGVDVIVIDPEKEFERLARSVDGRYINISLSSEHNINIFDIPTVLADESPEDVLKSTIIGLVGFFRVILGELTPEQDSIIDQAITQTYELKDITPLSDFSALEPPLLSDFERVLGGLDGGEEIVIRLTKFTKGTWAGFLNQPTNVDINKQFVVFSIRDMESELKSAAMHMITRFIWGSVRRNIRKRLLVVDEAWIMMKEKDTASFLFGMVKRGRKYYLGTSVITQDVGDFLKSPYGTSILTNASMVLLLRQSPTTIDVLQKTFNLTDEEKFILLEADVGEGIFVVGLKRVAIAIKASYMEEQIITTDPEVILAMKRKGN